MKTTTQSIAVFSLLAGTIASPLKAERYILESNAPLTTVEQEAAKNGVEVLRRLESRRGIVVEAASAASFESMRRIVIDLRVTPDVIMRASTLNIGSLARAKGSALTQQNTPWGLQALNAVTAWSFTRGSGVTVCVVDTGIDRTHPDLAGTIVGGRNFVAEPNKRLDPTKWDDENGNGTHVAGIIAARDNTIGVQGVAPSASLYAVRVLNAKGEGYLSDVADGVNECVNAGAHVINLGVEATADPTASNVLRTAVDLAIAANRNVVAAAGIGNVNINTVIPAGYPQAIAVTAVDQAMNFPSWTNYGLDTDDFTAPGVAILSTWRNGTYHTVSGTAAAAAHVSGVIALRISSGSLGLRANTLNQPISKEGAGLINAFDTVQNQ